MSLSDLAALLADVTQNGAYFVDVHDRKTLEAAATELGYAVVAIDCAGCSDKGEILERFAQALQFPDWFGGNWDALTDCLGDLSWWPAQGYLLLVDHVAAWRNDDPDAFAVLLEILNETAAAWADVKIPFWVGIPLSAQTLGDIDRCERS